MQLAPVSEAVPARQSEHADEPAGDDVPGSHIVQLVDPDAQKTDAYQSNRNLMLSDDAEANSLPGLEIQANDVRCTHGATSSRIDPEQEFYLQSRGIAKSAADELLTFGFFEEVLARLDHETLQESLRTLIKTKFKK